MPLSDDSSELSPSLAELTAPTVKAATTTTANQPAPAAVFPVTTLGPTNRSNQAPPNRHDDGDVDTPRQQNNVTLRSSDANTNSRQQTRPTSDAERDDDDGDRNPRRRIDSPPQRFLHRRGRDSYDNITRRGYSLEGDEAGDYPPTPNQQSGSEDDGDDNRYDNRQRNDNNQCQYNDDHRNNNDSQRSNNDNQRHNDNRRNYDDSNPPRDNRNTGPSYGTEQRNNNRRDNDGRQYNLRRGICISAYICKSKLCLYMRLYRQDLPHMQNTVTLGVFLDMAIEGPCYSFSELSVTYTTNCI